MKPLLLAIVALFALALPVAANEITSLTADCQGGIVASGTHFEAVTVTLTGPGYAKSAAVSGDWTHTFPLGANGSYSLDWPDSAEFGPVALTVRCATPQRPTPTPRSGRETTPPTLPPTDVDEAAGPMGPQGAEDEGLSPIALLALVMSLVALFLSLSLRSSRRRP